MDRSPLYQHQSCISSSIEPIKRIAPCSKSSLISTGDTYTKQREVEDGIHNTSSVEQIFEEGSSKKTEIIDVDHRKQSTLETTTTATNLKTKKEDSDEYDFDFDSLFEEEDRSSSTSTFIASLIKDQTMTTPTRSNTTISSSNWGHDACANFNYGTAIDFR